MITFSSRESFDGQQSYRTTSITTQLTLLIAILQVLERAPQGSVGVRTPRCQPLLPFSFWRTTIVHLEHPYTCTSNSCRARVRSGYSCIIRLSRKEQLRGRLNDGPRLDSDTARGSSSYFSRPVSRPYSQFERAAD